MISRTYFTETFYDMDEHIAQRFAEALRKAWVTGTDFEGEKKQGFFASLKGSKTMRGGFEDKLYVGNIHRIENHLYWNDEELADDDEIVNVVVIDGPVTRDGDGCSYGSKDHRDQIMYANTIPQVKGHVFIINTPGGAASARIDYEQAIADCRKNGKPTVAWIDGLCCSAGQLVASLCDRTVVMNGRNTMGCIGTMCAFWAVPHNTVDQDGYRYIELVSVTSPDKNAVVREAADGKTEKLQEELNRLGEEFRETVRQNRPLIKEEHLTGKTFDADEVMGELVDEIGDFNRAIECVFELAGQKLTAAASVTAEPEEQPGGEQSEENPKEMTNPQKEKDMTDTEKKAQEAEAAQAAQEHQDTPANEEANAGQQAAGESTQEQAGEHAAAAEEDAGEQDAEGAAQAAEPAAEPASQEAVENATAEIDKITETLHTAEQMIADKDKEIAQLKETLATLNGIAEERDAANKERDDANSKLSTLNAQLDEQGKALTAAEANIAERVATIEKLQKQVKELQGEVTELSEKPTPMVDANSGVPADNGTGEAPKQNKHLRDYRNMSYQEIRALQKEDAE